MRKRVADVIEPDAVGQLGVQQAEQVTPRGDASREIQHAGFARQRGHQVGRNEIANLPQDGELRPRWFGLGMHPCRVAGSQTKPNTCFCAGCGMAVNSIDMQTSCRDAALWPMRADDEKPDRWLHGDYKGPAYLYVHRLYERCTGIIQENTP